MTLNCKVEVNNVPSDCDRWIVARTDFLTKKLWYWGSFELYEDAITCATEFDNGVVAEKGE